MSELKSVHQSDVLWGHWFTEYYLKSEADKVLAEKDKEIAEQKKYIDELQDKVTDLLLRDKNMALYFNNAFNALTHSNYKRCMAMAKWCENMCSIMLPAISDWSKGRLLFYDRWYKIWCNLANKFKEAK